MMQFEQWLDNLPALSGEFDRDRQILGDYCQSATPWLEDDSLRHQVLLTQRQLRKRFAQLHAKTMADKLLSGKTHQYMSEIAFAAAKLVPGLVPDEQALAAEAELAQQQKLGLEADQGILFAAMLADPIAGQQLLDAQRLPCAKALSLLDQFNATGQLTLERISIEIQGEGAMVTFCNPESLNAEDNQLIADLEVAVDLVLLSDRVKVGVLRGGVVTHPRYKNKRIFSAGINLKHINEGKLAFADFLMGRELGYIHKMIRGIISDPELNANVEKPWISAVDTFAIGGGMQLLLASDLVIGAEDCYACLPAANEGIVPGVANLRLGQMAHGRLAIQVILQGRKIYAKEPDGSMVFDQVVTPAMMDRAIVDGIELMSPSSVVTNRRMLRLSAHPQGAFREYMSAFANEQVTRVYSDEVMEKTARFKARSSAGAK